jgi:aspartate/methionine/tyrosine aminotransferase
VARFPVLSAAGQAVPASIFLKLREHLARFPGDVIPLQIGDTHLAPPAALHDLRWADIVQGDLYAYGAPAGWGPLVDGIVERARTRNGLAVEASNVQIACGATHALSCSVQALCDRGEELILMTPHWPLIKGMALGHGVVPVEVPFAGEPAALAAAIEQAITPRTAAIYVATPNNPDGRMLSAADIDALAGVAERHDLWILSDEVYEHYGYDAAHVSIAAHPRAASRTVTVFSFAKSYAQAGLRVGYSLAPEPVTQAIKKLVNHSVYNVPVAMQRAALAAMQSGDVFLAGARERYRAARDRVRATLVAPSECPAGGAYVWVDFARWAGDDCMPVLERIAERGVLLAPGSAFGDACTRYARLCFTGVDEARLDEGIGRINAVLADLG